MWTAIIAAPSVLGRHHESLGMVTFPVAGGNRGSPYAETFRPGQALCKVVCSLARLGNSLVLGLTGIGRQTWYGDGYAV
jgi:hypothetical protein